MTQKIAFARYILIQYVLLQHKGNHITIILFTPTPFSFHLHIAALLIGTLAYQHITTLIIDILLIDKFMSLSSLSSLHFMSTSKIGILHIANCP
jgi:hypothetical protein